MICAHHWISVLLNSECDGPWLNGLPVSTSSKLQQPWPCYLPEASLHPCPQMLLCLCPFPQVPSSHVEINVALLAACQRCRPSSHADPSTDLSHTRQAGLTVTVCWCILLQSWCTVLAILNWSWPSYSPSTPPEYSGNWVVGTVWTLIVVPSHHSWQSPLASALIYSQEVVEYLFLPCWRIFCWMPSITSMYLKHFLFTITYSDIQAIISNMQRPRAMMLEQTQAHAVPLAFLPIQ